MKKLFYGWWVVAAISVVLILGMGSAFYTASVFLEPIQETLGWTRTQVSLGFMIAALVAAAVSPFVGLAIAKFGVKKVFAFGAVVTGLALALLGQIQQLWHYYALTFVLAIGISCLGLITGTTCVSHWFNRRRGAATGVIFAASGVGGMTMVFLASQAVERLGWRPTYMLLGAILFSIVLPVILITIKNKPEDMGLEVDGAQVSDVTEQHPIADNGYDLKDAARTLPYWLLAFLMLCYGTAFGAMGQHAIALLRDLGVGEPGIFWSITLGISVLGRLVFGILADRFPKKNLVSITWLFHFIGLSAALFVPNALSLVWAFAFFYGAGQGAFGTVFSVFLGQLFGTEHFSKLYGTILVLQAVGFSIGAVLFGTIFDSTGSYTAAIWIVAAMSLVCIAVTAMIRQPKARAEHTGATDLVTA
jgi:MFS family permease